MIKTIAILLSLAIPSMAIGEVTFDKETKYLRIVGPTDMDQVIEASQYLRNNEVDYITMWGPGGRLTMSIQLGKLISKEDGVTVVIPKGKACISACAFAAMGSKHIRIYGKLMLHRPFVKGIPVMERIEDALAFMGKGYLMLAYYLEDLGYERSVMNSIMTYTSPCKFMKYEGLTIKNPEELVLWVTEDRCGMLNRIVR